MSKRTPDTAVTVGELVFGELSECKVTDGYRVTIPEDFLKVEEGIPCILAIERVGCVSLWLEDAWRQRLEVISTQLQGEKCADTAQQFARLLATRQRVSAQRGRQVALPPKFRKGIVHTEEAEKEGEKPRRFVTIVGMGFYVEIWNPESWDEYVSDTRHKFWTLFDSLAAVQRE